MKLYLAGGNGKNKILLAAVRERERERDGEAAEDDMRCYLAGLMSFGTTKKQMKIYLAGEHTYPALIADHIVGAGGKKFCSGKTTAEILATQGNQYEAIPRRERNMVLDISADSRGEYG